LIRYRSRPAFQAFHKRQQRWACIVAHRRAGKTVAAINDLIKKAMRCEKSEPRFAYVAPFTSQAKDVAWSYLRQFTSTIRGASASVSELKVDLPNGGRIRLYGADNYPIQMQNLLNSAVGLIPRTGTTKTTGSVTKEGGGFGVSGIPFMHGFFGGVSGA
jgi:hypothetical protein